MLRSVQEQSLHDSQFKSSAYGNVVCECIFVLVLRFFRNDHQHNYIHTYLYSLLILISTGHDKATHTIKKPTHSKSSNQCKNSIGITPTSTKRKPIYTWSRRGGLQVLYSTVFTLSEWVALSCV
jgi:hypothetical protein